MHHLHLLELSQQLARHATVVAVALKLRDNCALVGHALLADSNVTFGFGEMLTRSMPKHNRTEANEHEV